MRDLRPSAPRDRLIKSALWFVDNVDGPGSTPVQITHNVTIGTWTATPQARNTYSIAANKGTVYVAYAQESGAGRDVYLLARSQGGAWSSPTRVSPPDAQGCHKFGVALAARAGRIGLAYIRTYGGNCKVVSIAVAPARAST